MTTPTHYGVPQTEVVCLNNQNFGNSTLTFNYIGPFGREGHVEDIVADVSTAMVGTTTVPEIDVGTASGDTTYAQYRLGTAAGAGYATGVHRAQQEAWTGNPPITLSDFAGHVALNKTRIPKNTAFVITLKAGTGGAPAGVANVYVVIKWF
ncbi:MAG: hypothetical protein JO328_21350 [Hyphomicrobiales bacterium]|nr:hypothetical protein [Hyphomicrobiales bacterium]MBV9429113.1 hypothetical protein [Bradyrhizobiaceae bacterium]